jgi:Flp pilus assembly protein TadB
MCRLESKASLIITAGFTLLLLASNSYLVTHGRRDLLWSPALAGSAFALMFAWAGVLTKLRRFYLVALLSLCAGIVLAVLGVDYFRGVAVLAGVVGLILLVQGYRVHKAYVSQNRPPGGTTDE